MFLLTLHLKRFPAFRRQYYNIPVFRMTSSAIRPHVFPFKKKEGKKDVGKVFSIQKPVLIFLERFHPRLPKLVKAFISITRIFKETA